MPPHPLGAPCLQNSSITFCDFVGERLNSDQAEEIIEHAAKADEEGMVKYEEFINRVLAGPFPEEEND